MPEEVDLSASGVSFVDILFALVVTTIMNPVQDWVRDPAKTSLPTGYLLHLVVALVLVLTSWVGYHNSANRPQFRMRFFNADLTKFVLDICMVVDYFLVASIAIRKPLSNRGETALVAAAFVLYFLWDVAGYIQKRPNSQYETAWEIQKRITPEIGPWKPRQLIRVLTTFTFGALTGLLTIVVWTEPNAVTVRRSAFCDGIVLAILILYRIAKDHGGVRGSGRLWRAIVR